MLRLVLLFTHTKVMGYLFFSWWLNEGRLIWEKYRFFQWFCLSSWQAAFSCQYKVKDAIADIFIFFETALENLDRNLCSPRCVGNRAG